MRISIDIDGTICTQSGDGNYASAEPMKYAIELANNLYDKGHTITYWTARGSLTGKDWTELTTKQLQEWGCKYHHLVMKKPAYDILIDDKAINAAVWHLGGNDKLGVH